MLDSSRAAGGLPSLGDWQQDQADRGDPDTLTRLFHASVPVLKYLDWKVVETGRGYASTVLPLNVASSNQHITHQAAVILIAADYAGGIALGTLFHGVPLVGIHPQETDYGAYLWGAKAGIRWIRPSANDLHVVARIEEVRHEKIARRFFEGRRVLETVKVNMFNDEGPVAEARITYWVQDTYALRRDAFDENRIHLLYDHRRKTSAKLVAGLRALEQRKPNHERLFADRFAERIAGKHGVTLAERFCLIAPEIQLMVAARTRNADEVVSEFANLGPLQLVNIGSGLDLRPMRISLPAGSTVFNLDLPRMLARRRQELAALGIAFADTIDIGIDLYEHDPDTILLGRPEFDPARPTLVIWEGGSMYFDRAVADRILASVRRLMKTSHSKLWFDYVTNDVVLNQRSLPAVSDFNHAMRSLGEPFVNGYDDISVALAGADLFVAGDQSSGEHLRDGGQLFDFYRFCVAEPA